MTKHEQGIHFLRGIFLNMKANLLGWVVLAAIAGVVQGGDGTQVQGRGIGLTAVRHPRPESYIWSALSFCFFVLPKRGEGLHVAGRPVQRRT